ncbi:MAG: tripartite tricarboxylate transporter TctB family protein [Pseudomonadota bacterium]
MTLDSAKADQWTSVILFALGAAMLVGGYTMDRLEIRQIHPASIPGLVPIILGAAMMLCSGLLFWSARQRAGDARSTDGAPVVEGSVKNLAFAAGYSVLYAIGLVGWLPFWLATAIYISVFYVHFSWQADATNRSRLLHAGLGLAFGIVGAFAIATLFEHGFLVRLP